MRARETPAKRKNGSGPVGHDGKHPTPLFSDEHDDQSLVTYLERLSQGIGLDLAAREIGSTATRMRRYASREPELARAIEEAVAEGDEHYTDRLRATARVLALNTNQPQPRILEVELATHVPGYEHLRRDRVQHSGRIEHGITLDLDPAKLDAMDPEKLAALREALASLDEVVIDAEFTEVNGRKALPTA